MNNKIIISVFEEDIYYIQSLFYRQLSINNLLGLLATQEDTQQEWMDYYFNELASITAELEMAKDEISQKYKPSSITEEFDFNIKFDDFTIEYSIRGNNE